MSPAPSTSRGSPRPSFAGAERCHRQWSRHRRHGAGLAPNRRSAVRGLGLTAADVVHRLHQPLRPGQADRAPRSKPCGACGRGSRAWSSSWSGRRRAAADSAARLRGRRVGAGDLTGFLESPARILPMLDLYVASSRKEGLRPQCSRPWRPGSRSWPRTCTATVTSWSRARPALLVAPEDPARVADAIAALLTDPARRKSLGHAGRERVRQEFTMRAMVDATAAAYRVDRRSEPDRPRSLHHQPRPRAGQASRRPRRLHLRTARRRSRAVSTPRRAPR